MERSDWSMASGLEKMERSDWSRGDEGMERMEGSCACVRALCMDVYENLPCPTVGCVVLKELTTCLPLRRLEMWTGPGP